SQGLKVARHGPYADLLGFQARRQQTLRVLEDSESLTEAPQRSRRHKLSFPMGALQPSVDPRSGAGRILSELGPSPERRCDRAVPIEPSIGSDIR
ncbi:hypothetical protein, partial [Neisseria gonorrhoeae]|uniref:hypothetical protein n=1 Tax=Neisseria gonorrhoeae TaxID=485 RepID=UPI00311FDF96